MMNILICEDHDWMRTSLNDWLQIKFPACRIIEAIHGEEAIQLASHHKPEIAVIDIELPGINGIEATKKIKEISPLTNIVILTIHKNQEYMEQAQLNGADTYILKDRAHVDLYPVMKELISKKKSLAGKPK